MQIAWIKIENFRAIAQGELLLSEHSVLVGDNNTGKSTILEAIDLVLGPERLSRYPAVDEHDFYAGRYLNEDGTPIPINIEVVVIKLNEEQKRYFRDHLQWWNMETNSLIGNPPADATDKSEVVAALKVNFVGIYDKEEDEFVAKTYFFSPTPESGESTPFKTADKRMCGFLFLRTLRTASRALSLERGSLLDIILKLKDKRLQMWEDVLIELRKLPVAENPELGIINILSDVQDSVRSFVPSDWADNPHIRVSDLTRENLRKTLTVFMDTGAKKNDGTNYAAPFHHQGTGTINIIVLAMLSLIAELKQNVIFAMEEPEIAIPPHTQKSIIDTVCSKSSQALFTSHSPYVLEEFEPNQIVVLQKKDGIISGMPANFPITIKRKKYRSEFRTRFCEALLARRVLIVEGRTEYDAFLAAARRLHELNPEDFSSLEALGIAVISADTDSQVAPLCEHFKKFGKQIFAIFDKQESTRKQAIEAVCDYPFETEEKGCEEAVIKGTNEDALRRFAIALVNDGDWPTHLSEKKPTESMTLDNLQNSLLDYFRWSKGSGGIADLLGQCSCEEMPTFVVDIVLKIKNIIQHPTSNTEVEGTVLEEQKIAEILQANI